MQRHQSWDTIGPLVWPGPLGSERKKDNNNNNDDDDDDDNNDERS